MVVNTVANTDDVEYLSDALGYNKEFAFSQPKGVSRTESSGGSVSFDNRGAIVDAGDTQGGIARIYATEVNTKPFKKLAFDGVFLSRSSSYTDKVLIGQSIDDASADAAAFWDLTNEQYQVRSQTTPSISPPGSFTRFYLRIEVDRIADETTFSVSTETQTDEQTVQEAPAYLRGNIINAEAIGGGSGAVQVKFARLRMEPKV